VAEEAGIPVIAVATLADLLDFASGNPELVGYRQPLEAYRAQYGVRSTR
jgi:orotate phosphoribosyltransferase